MPGRLETALFGLANQPQVVGFVATVTTTNPLTVDLDGASIPDVRAITDYSPAAGDAVVVLTIGNEPIVIGAIA